MEGVKTFTRKSHADKTTGSVRYKINGFGRRILSCHAEVSLIFAILVIPNKHHAPGSYLFHGGSDTEMSSKDVRWIRHRFFHPSLKKSKTATNRVSVVREVKAAWRDEETRTRKQHIF
jgi:hypothetical protein